jgi:NADPH:quinone reductase-like Zn-dependent oxidoreductase
MKSARVDAFTQRPEDIRIDDVPVPEPGPGQVRVRMIASPVHPSDFHFVQGIYYKALQRVIWNHAGASPEGRVYFDPQRRDECPSPPYALGREGLGIVEASGGGFMARRLVGKRVLVSGGPPNGVWQEHVAIDARRAFAVPRDLPDDQAAMYLANPFSACVLVREILKAPRDSWVLVTAAGSALGKSVVRMGRRDGFRTICVVRSSANSAELTKLGADAVIETDHHDLIAEVARLTAGQGVGFALDSVGGKLAGDVVRCLGVNGRLVLYGTMAETPIELHPRDLMMPMARIEGFYAGNWVARQSPLKLLGVLRAVKRLTAEGVFETEVSETYPLEQVAAAVAASLRPGRTGKVMLRIG